MVWDKIKSVAKAAPSAVTAGLSGKLLTFLLVFVFANIGILLDFLLLSMHGLQVLLAGLRTLYLAELGHL